jgi:hypothetical protein
MSGDYKAPDADLDVSRSFGASAAYVALAVLFIGLICGAMVAWLYFLWLVIRGLF